MEKISDERRISMNLEITTPAVLFPSVSLLLLAYTNRFLALASIVRQMDVCTTDEYQMNQIKNLQKRMRYIKKMQYFGVASLLLCVVSMFFLFFQVDLLGMFFFVISLILMIISLEALEIHLNHCEYKEEDKEK